MNNLNERAARAMGWERVVKHYGYGIHEEYWVDNEKVSRSNWNPLTDRNAAHELLLEVGRRGLMEKLSQEIYLYDECPSIIEEDTYATLEKSVYGIMAWLLTAPLELLIQAAVEVMESEEK